MNKFNLMAVVLAVLLLSVSGWGACRNVGASTCDATSQCYLASNCGNSCASFCNAPKCPTDSKHVILGPCVYTNNASPTCGKNYGETGSCSSWLITPKITCQNTLSCDTQCEADSVACVSDGNIWQDDPSTACGKSCKINHCTSSDSTWLLTSIAACTGSNNYAIVNTDSTCEHVGTCCPNDSIPSGNVCKWRCDSVLTQCNGRAGALFGAVLPDTSVSGQDTTFSYQCFYNCAHSPNPDSTVYLVEGNTILAGPSDSIADGMKSEWFSSVRSTTGGIYVYDYLSPSASEYVDSIAAMKCVEHLWRCVINNKYVYWYDNQEVPAGCTNIVRVK